MPVQYNILTLLGTLCISAAAQTAAPAPAPSFRAQTIDDKIQIGYGLAIADVQGDGRPDILLADKKQIVWYENPTWKKHVIAENLTEKDNVCIAARDIDGDGRCEIAVGAEWNPADTVNSGAVFYLIPPEGQDRTQKWEAVRLHHEPTTHRMKWVQRGKGRFDLVVLPLHGRGNKNGEGDGVRMLAYQMPESGNPRDEWTTELLSDDMHMTHNFEVIPGAPDQENIMLSGREGWKHLDLSKSKDSKDYTTLRVFHDPVQGLKGVGEIRHGKASHKFTATVEPMHGNQLAVYTAFQPTGGAKDINVTRAVLDDTLADGHALACADVLGTGSDQIIVGWRAMSSRIARVGIKLFELKDPARNQWQSYLIDDNTMACEDLLVADLNDDGKPEIIASGRRSQNVIIYWNETKPVQ